MRGGLRFASSVAVVSAFVLVVDVVVTLAWQEPIGALVASRHQHRLAAEPATLGHIVLPTSGAGTSSHGEPTPRRCARGPGHHPSTALPGDGTNVGIAGHRTTYGAPFRAIDRLERGDPVVVDVPYGRFVYRVQRTRVVRPTDTWIVRRTTHERLVLTACHPLYSARQRIVVFATLVLRSGRPTSISPASRRSSDSTSAATSTSDTSTTSSQ